MERNNSSFNLVPNFSYLNLTKGDESHWEKDPRFLATFYTMYKIGKVVFCKLSIFLYFFKNIEDISLFGATDTPVVNCFKARVGSLIHAWQSHHVTQSPAFTSGATHADLLAAKLFNTTYL